MRDAGHIEPGRGERRTSADAPLSPRIGLLDSRFNYVSAAATDVADTWKRFGFDPRANAERRARLKRHLTLVAANAGDDEGLQP